MATMRYTICPVHPNNKFYYSHQSDCFLCQELHRHKPLKFLDRLGTQSMSSAERVTRWLGELRKIPLGEQFGGFRNDPWFEGVIERWTGGGHLSGGENRVGNKTLLLHLAFLNRDLM